MKTFIFLVIMVTFFSCNSKEDQIKPMSQDTIICDYSNLRLVTNDQFVKIVYHSQEEQLLILFCPANKVYEFTSSSRYDIQTYLLDTNSMPINCQTFRLQGCSSYDLVQSNGNFTLTLN